MRGLKIVCLLVMIGLLANISIAQNQDPTAEEFYQAERTFEANDFVKAEQMYRVSLGKYQNMKSMAAYIENQIAKCLRYQGKADAAVEQYKKVQTAYPDSPVASDVQSNIARTYYEARDYAKAGPEFEKLGEVIDQEIQKTQENDKAVSAAIDVKSENANKSEKRIEAYGYAELCYSKSGRFIKAWTLKKKYKGKE